MLGNISYSTNFVISFLLHGDHFILADATRRCDDITYINSSSSFSSHLLCIPSCFIPKLKDKRKKLLAVAPKGKHPFLSEDIVVSSSWKNKIPIRLFWIMSIPTTFRLFVSWRLKCSADDFRCLCYYCDISIS